jgi:hypothetical protein
VRGRPAVGGEEGDLAVLLLLVLRDQVGQGIRGRLAGGQPIESAWAVAALGEGLGGDRSDAGPRPRAARDVERAGLHSHAQLAARLVPPDDRIRHTLEPS